MYAGKFRIARHSGAILPSTRVHIRPKCLLVVFGRFPGALLQSLDDIKVGEQAAVTINVGFRVGRHQDGAEELDSCRICWPQFFPKLSPTSGEFYPIDFRRQVCRAVDKDGMAVAAPGDR